MLGVLPNYRNSGIGRELKLKQREYAIATGVDLIEWTFDPLEIKNAFFNIERLGAIARRYVHNQYGMTTSHLHGGLPTDRLVAEWWIQSPRAAALSSGALFEAPVPQARIEVAADIAELRRRDKRLAREIQSAVGEQFDKHFHDGLAVIGFEKTRRSGNLLTGQMGIKVDRIILRHIRMPLVHFFETSFGRTHERDIILVEVFADSISGWGEVTAGENPFYNEEWTGSIWPLLD